MLLKLILIIKVTLLEREYSPHSDIILETTTLITSISNINSISYSITL